MHIIEIDNNVWNHLKKYAEPLEDTPNSVLKRLLFDKTMTELPKPLANMNIQGVPVALSQIFEVLYEMACRGLSRIDATHQVAQKRGTSPQTIIDKYCRQLNKRAHQIDALLSEPGLAGFKALLKDKYSQHSSVIDIFFETLHCEHPPPDIGQEEIRLAELDSPVYSGLD